MNEAININQKETLEVSTLGKTWLLDIDGTIVKHNGYKIDGVDTLLSGAKEFFEKIAPGDKIILLTSRDDSVKEKTIEFLNENQIRYDDIIWNLPFGERILINDKKPSGLKTALCINTTRDEFLKYEIKENKEL